MGSANALYLGDRVTYDIGWPNQPHEATIVGFPHGCEVRVRTDAGAELTVPFHRVARCAHPATLPSEDDPSMEAA